MNNTAAITYSIEADMGIYGPFDSYSEARGFQKLHQLTGSSIIEN